MSLVRFAMICDQCGKRSPEYTSWWSCRECAQDVCDDCSAMHTRDDEAGMADCIECIADKARLEMAK